MMINCDMVGRLNAKNELTMIGTGTTPGIDALVDVLGKSAGLTIKKVAGMTDGFGGSDHQSFYARNIPVLFAFTGIHGDYHRPSDDSDRINYSGMARIADYLELIALDVIRRPDRPTYVAVTEHAAAAACRRRRRAVRVRRRWESCPIMVMRPTTASAWRECERRAGRPGGIEGRGPDRQGGRPARSARFTITWRA